MDPQTKSLKRVRVRVWVGMNARFTDSSAVKFLLSVMTGSLSVQDLTPNTFQKCVPFSFVCHFPGVHCYLISHKLNDEILLRHASFERPITCASVT